jgi:hypothetical protein
LDQPAETELVDGVEEEGAAEEERTEGGRQNRKEWPNYLVKMGDAEKIHLQRALHLLQPRVEKPSKDRSRRYIAANFLPGFRPIDGEHDLVRFRVYAFKNKRGLHGRCFSLGFLSDIVVDGDAGVHSASKKKAGVQVVLAPLLMELPVRSEVWQYRRGERTMRPRVACTSVIMEVELEEAERDGRKVLQLAEESKAELEGADYRPREVEEVEEEEEGLGQLSEEARRRRRTPRPKKRTCWRSPNWRLRACIL